MSHSPSSPSPSPFLLRLPPELHLIIAHHLDDLSSGSTLAPYNLASLLQTCHYFHTLLTPLLYTLTVSMSPSTLSYCLRQPVQKSIPETLTRFFIEHKVSPLTELDIISPWHGSADYMAPPLHHAVYDGNPDAARWFLGHFREEAMEAEAGRKGGAERGTPVLWAAVGEQAEGVRLLVEYGADLGRVNGKGNGVVHFAGWYGNEEMVGILAERGGVVPLVNERNKAGLRPVELAVEGCWAETAKTLVERLGADVRCKGERNGKTLLHRAVLANYKELGDPGEYDTTIMIGSYGVRKWTDLYPGLSRNPKFSERKQEEVMESRADIVRWLVKKGLEADEIDTKGRTPLGLLAGEGCGEKMELWVSGDEYMETGGGFDGFEVDEEVEMRGNVEVAVVLLEGGASVEKAMEGLRKERAWKPGCYSEGRVEKAAERLKMFEGEWEKWKDQKRETVDG